MNTNANNITAGKVTLQALGGAETVTGSKYLLRTPSLNLLIDCGLFQGPKALREQNWIPPAFAPAAVDAVIITHAHLDHCGYLPLWVKNGYKGKVYMSRPTAELAELILRDSARLQEEDAEKANKHGYSKHRPAKPLYNTADVEACLPCISRCMPDETYALNEQISFRLYPAGHITGACSVDVECYGKHVFFSGDIGRYHSEYIKPPQNDVAADIVVMESTYGDRLHEHYDVDCRLAFLINNTLETNGNMLIPCFAVGRAQEIIHRLNRLKLQKEIPQELPVYLDSPMAEAAGQITMHYPEWLAIGPKETAALESGVLINEHAFGTEKIIHQKGSKIILAASGMLTGGRSLEYLKHYLPNHKNTILLIGFQAAGTRGRALLNHASEIKLYGKYYPVNAHVEYIDALSAHADQAELLQWLKGFKKCPEHIYLVHGEPCAQEALRVKVKDTIGLEPIILRPYQPVDLFDTVKHPEIVM